MGRRIKNTEFRVMYKGSKLNKELRKAENANMMNELWYTYISVARGERKARLVNNDEIIRGCEKFISVIESRINSNTTLFDIVIYKDLLLIIEKEKSSLLRQQQGGIKSVITKEMKKVEEKIEEYKPRELVFTTLNVSPFSHNYMYQADSWGNLHRTNAYNQWIKYFPRDEVPSKLEYEIFEGIDFRKPIGLEIRYVCKAEMDIRNGDKSAIDMIFNRCLKVDDNIIAEVKSTRVGTCDTYEEGKIIFAIYNV